MAFKAKKNENERETEKLCER